MFSIPILPMAGACKETLAALHPSEVGDPFGGCTSLTYGPSGRWLLDALLGQLELSREDEIAVITTTDEVYVSTCVSATAFNHARVSRVVGRSTRVVIAIHEFGYVVPDFYNRCRSWQEQEICVIEDCAHVIGASYPGGTVGMTGDHGLFSLPKIVPVAAGGILRTSLSLLRSAMTADEKARTELGILGAERFLGMFATLNDARRERHQLVESALAGLVEVEEPSPHGVPWFVRLRVRRGSRVRQALPSVEWGATRRDDLLLLPTNPFVAISVFRDVADRLQRVLKECGG